MVLPATADSQPAMSEAMTKAITASAQVARKVRGEMTVEWTRDMQELAALWVDLLDNKVSPNQGLMVSPIDCSED